MALRQKILDQSSVDDDFIIQEEDYVITHFSIRGKKGTELQITYNSSFVTLLTIPSNEFLELSSAVIAISSIQILTKPEGFEKIQIDYETTAPTSASLNLNQEQKQVQYIMGPPGAAGPGIKDIEFYDTQIIVLLENGKKIVTEGNFIGTGIDNIEQINQEKIKINLTDKTSYIINLPRGEKGDSVQAIDIRNEHLYVTLEGQDEKDLGKVIGPSGTPGQDAEFGEITGKISMLDSEASPSIVIHSQKDDLKKTNLVFDFKIPQGVQGVPGPQGGSNGVFIGTKKDIESVESGDIFLWVDISEEDV